MPERKRAELNQALCFRCQENPHVITIRNDPLCKICFGRYVSAKVVKRMDSFRVRQNESQDLKTLLIALSCGTCSCALLHLMHNQLERQRDRSGRVGFKLHIIHVEGSPGNDDRSEDIWTAIQNQYPGHTYSRLNFESLSLPLDLAESIQHHELFKSTSNNVATLINSVQSTSTRADVAQILLRKVITKFALDNHCDAILWGDSTTTLAGRVLAETAKGRGINLPSISADGDSTSGISCHYPMRDLLSKEIYAYIQTQEYDYTKMLTPAEVKPSVSTKKTTIDNLMKQYFESVDREYPSIVTNVVKTTEKLRKDPISTTETYCELCDMPLRENAPEKSRLCNTCVRALSVAS